MRLEKWALVAEIVGALAIVVSLIFVGLEVRQNTFATYAATYDQLLADIAEWRLELATSTELIEELREVQPQWSRASVYMAAGVQAYERAYFARLYGMLGEEEWKRFEQNLCARKADVAEFGITEGTFSPGFWEFLQQQEC